MPAKLFYGLNAGMDDDFESQETEKLDIDLDVAKQIVDFEHKTGRSITLHQAQATILFLRGMALIMIKKMRTNYLV